VAIVGDFETANIAKTAVEMLIQGRRHSTVYKYVENETFTLKRRRMRELWIKPSRIEAVEEGKREEK